MNTLCSAFVDPLGYHSFTLNITPFSNHPGFAVVLLLQHTSAQGSRLVTVALGPERLGGKGVVK